MHKRPDSVAGELSTNVIMYNVVKGFLNVEISSAYWLEVLNEVSRDSKYGYRHEKSGHSYMIEYSSPNTNKPLHLGHIRNNLLGWSVSEIQKANGHEVKMSPAAWALSPTWA